MQVKRGNTIMAIILSIMMVCSSLAIPVTAQAEEATSPISYEFNNGVAGDGTGVVKIVAPTSETASFDSYVLYWGDANGKLADFWPIITLTKADAQAGYQMVNCLAIPKGATRLLAYLKSGDTELKNYEFAIPTAKQAANETPINTMFFISDTHVDTIQTQYGLNLDHALKDIKNINEAADTKASGIVIDGDLVNGIYANGDDQVAQYKAFKQIVSDNSENLPQVVYNIGNHDCYNNGRNADNFFAAMDRDYLYFETTIGNQHLLLLGGMADTVDISDQLGWLDQKLAADAAKGVQTYVFLHQGINNTVSGTYPGQWMVNTIANESALTAVLNKYPSAIFISGHSHMTLDARVTALNGMGACPSYINDASTAYLTLVDADNYYGKTDDDYTGTKGSQGIYVEVYKDKLILHGRDFKGNQWIPRATLKIDLVNSETNLPAILSITGSKTAGETVTASLTANGSPYVNDNLTYTWYADQTKRGEGSSYTIQSADTGKKITVVVRDTTTGKFKSTFMGSTVVDKTELSSAITAATTAEKGIAVDTVATNVPVGTKWVTAADMKTFTDAISAAQTVNGNSAAIQADVNAAASAVTAAKDTFTKALQDGTKVATVDKTALLAAIAAATTAENGIVVDTVAANVLKGTKWVTATDMKTYTDAISAAQTVYGNNAATKADVESAVSSLNAAKDTFTKALQDGTATLDKSTLLSAITEANAAKKDVVTGTIASDAVKGTKWVTVLQLATFTNAISAAQKVYDSSTATRADVDSAVSTLNTAKDTFTKALQDGTYVVDKYALVNLIAAANLAKTSVSVSTLAAYVSQGTSWVTEAEFIMLTNAISNAQKVNDNALATQDDVDTVTGALRAAQYAFSAAFKDGTNVSTSVIVDKTELLNAITAATWAKLDVSTDTNAANVCDGINWVTANDMSALTSALSIAETVYNTNAPTRDAVISATSSLNTALTTFTSALKAGTQPATKDDLQTVLTKANAEKAGVVVNTKASDVATISKWVLSSEMKAYKAAIDSADAIYKYTASEQQIATAIKTLNAAKTTFMSVKKDGTYTSSSGGSTSGGSTSGGSTSGGSTSGGSTSGGSTSGGSTSGGSTSGGSTSGSSTSSGTSTQTSTSGLTDISGHWAYSAIIAMKAKGVVSGTPDGKFEPDKTATRAEFAKMAAVAFSYTASGTTSTFSDVSSSAWFASYINALSSNNIISGVSADSFSPNGSLTREQLATIVYRILKAKSITLTSSSTAFSDESSISSWAKDAVHALQAKGVISGKGSNQFDPKGYATKAEVASILQRALALVQ